MWKDRQYYEQWKEQLIRDLQELNYKSWDYIYKTGERFTIGYRGKYHRVVLLKNDETIACGIRGISEAIIKYKRKYGL